MKKFTEYNLHPDLQKGIDAAGFEACTPVQEQTFEAIFNGRDVTVKSQTGTGKTAAFLISLFQTLLESRQARELNGEGDQGGDQVLVLAPTRELVVQIEEEAQVLSEYLDFKFATVYGGVGYNRQEDELAANPDFIIATPGRLMDFMQSRKIDSRRFTYLVIDEADRMFDMGFYPDIQKILRGMRPPVERRTLLFSATLGTKVLNIAWQHMNEPVDIEIEPEHITVDAIDQTLYHVSREEKMSLLLGLIQKHKPESAFFFTNTKRMAEELSNRLRANNFTAEFIMGDLPQKKRLRIINAVKHKEIRFLVATDVAARGLHIDDLEMVFNYDLPEDSENYVHRIGRTARAGASGKAISLADEHSVYNLSSIESFLGMKIPVENISDDLLAEDHSRGVRFHSEYFSNRSSGGRSGSHGGDRGHGGRSWERNRKSSSGDGRRDGRARADQSQADRRPQNSDRHRDERKRDDQKRSAKPSAGRRDAQKSKSHGKPSKPISKMSKEERLSYYADKYGEEFSGAQKSGKPSGRNQRKRSADQGRGKNRDQKQREPAKRGQGSAGSTDRKSKGSQRGTAKGERAKSGSAGGSRKPSAQTGAAKAAKAPARDDKQSAKSKQEKGLRGFLKRVFGGE
jgi:ATP-dependent RNA helicase RhlB